MTLHWHTPESPCLVAGEPVLPDIWTGGVFCRTVDGTWDIYKPLTHPLTGAALGYELAHDDFGALEYCQPIFPPKGWAGKTDWELWQECSTKPHGQIGWLDWAGEPLDSANVGQLFIDGRTLRTGYNDVAMIIPAVLNLQNALTLARRLGFPT